MSEPFSFSSSHYRGDAAAFDAFLHAMPHYFDAFAGFEYRTNRSSNKLRYNGENSAFPLKGASWTL
ncbi:MAG: hypothetical protein PUI93_04990, partial [Ellagibacter isourolithinifaciens]|uniref:hypothetical protein n=1 Tax=Ellagibacter isourolithinifaciens TaxID=2137581 RepID=UPI0023F02249